jgi:hypothetical protein
MTTALRALWPESDAAAGSAGDVDPAADGVGLDAGVGTPVGGEEALGDFAGWCGLWVWVGVADGLTERWVLVGLGWCEETVLALAEGELDAVDLTDTSAECGGVKAMVKVLLPARGSGSSTMPVDASRAGKVSVMSLRPWKTPTIGFAPDRYEGRADHGCGPLTCHRPVAG